MVRVADWTWSDYGPHLGRYSLFLRSGEFITTLFLIATAVALVMPRSMFARSPAFQWIASTSQQGFASWAILAIALSITGPLAVLMDKGLLRILSTISQGLYLLTFGISFRIHQPTGLTWLILIICGTWLLFRAWQLLHYHRGLGGANGHKRAG